MEKLIFRFTSIITASIVFILHIIGFLLSQRDLNRFVLLIWVAISIVDIVLIFTVGKAVEILFKHSFEDSMTELGNKRAFHILLKDHLRRMKKGGSVLSLSFIDVDNLKQINDSLGHIAGDRVIREVSKIIRQSIRKEDKLVRWGGDEFAIILPGADNQGAFSVIERIRMKIEIDNTNHLNTTISAGIATTKRYMEPEELLAIADKALYKSKETKNKVTCL